MARVGTGGQKFEVFPVGSDGWGEVTIEVSGEYSIDDTSTGNGKMLKAKGPVIEVHGETPEATESGQPILGRTFPFQVWIHPTSNAEAEFVEACEIKADKDGWDGDDMIGKLVRIRYKHKTFEGDIRVDVKRYLPAD